MVYNFILKKETIKKYLRQDNGAFCARSKASNVMYVLFPPHMTVTQ